MPVALAVIMLVLSVMLVGLTLFFAIATLVAIANENGELMVYDFVSTVFCVGMLWFIEGTTYDAFVRLFC